MADTYGENLRTICARIILYINKSSHLRFKLELGLGLGLGLKLGLELGLELGYPNPITNPNPYLNLR